MKLLRISVYAGVAVMTFVSGMSMVAGGRALYAVVVRQLAPAIERPSVEPVPVPLAGSVTVEYASDESCRAEEAGVLEPEELRAFDPSGAYSLDPESTPKAFADFEYFEVEAREYYYENDRWVSRAIVPHGLVQARKKTLKLERIGFAEKELAFQTETVDGISYRFVGKFDDRGPNLVGKLIKIKHGKWAAEMNAEFYINGC